MEIREQIKKLSGNPIFYMSPNIGIKFSLIKSNPHLINEKYRGFLNLILNGKKIDFMANQKIDSDFLALVIIEYLHRQKSEFLKYFNLDLYIDKMHEKDIFYANAFLAYYYYDNNNYERTEQYIKFSLKYVENNEVSDYEKVCIYSLTAYFLKTQSIFINDAGSYFINALELIKDNDYLGEISILNSLSYYYHNIEKRDTAIKYINIALEMVRNHKLGISSFTTYKNSGIIYTTIGDFEKAKWSFKKAFEFFNDLVNNPEEKVKLLNTLGYVEFLKGDFLDSFENYENALMLLINEYNNVTKLLDEAVKTFDNFGNVLKFLGKIDASIYIQLFGKEILERINSVNRLNEFHNLRKSYIDISLTYLLYKCDAASANFYLQLSKINPDENEHYVNKNKSIILEILIQLSNEFNPSGEKVFYDAVEELKIKGKDNLYAQILLIEFLIYYYKLKGEKNLLIIAREITQKYNLNKHYEAVYKGIFKEETIQDEIIDFRKYPLNLIRLLSKEKKELLIETKKSDHFELIEEFINNISKAVKEEELFEISEKDLSQHFFSKGFVVLKSHKKKFAFSYFSKTIKEIIEELGDFFISEVKEISEQKILNYDESIFIKSCMVQKIDYKEDDLTYYFILFNDKKNDWNFNFEELKTFGILINNLYLKHKNIKQLEKIEQNAVTDYLTGYKNPSYYNKIIKELIKKYEFTGETFGMSLIDLDKFKNINDIFGHDVGDKLLKYFSKILKKKIKGKIEFIRYGGDEFILLFDPEINMEKEFAKVKRYFVNYPLIENGKKIIIDFSFGIEFYKGQLETELFKSADNKMYKQKK